MTSPMVDHITRAHRYIYWEDSHARIDEAFTLPPSAAVVRLSLGEYVSV